MEIEFDTHKRNLTLELRGLDFAECGEVLESPVAEFEDDRYDYTEQRVTAIGFLGQRLVVVVWTPRGEAKRIISMRKANEREIKRYLG